ncbi:MAG: cohesin domain-containing protein [Candidatus Bathyarchaeota archaeon]|nr:cohesin domain-containing protein [Candidatus Bathyarchaeota archaeon]MDW8040343.1 cohesin domain-containing protein [Nitrososphaerota archaeon]
MFKRKTATALILAMLVSAIPLSTVWSSAEETVVRVEPSTINLPPGSNFVIKVKVENVVNLYGLDIKLRWDPSILGYVRRVVKIPVENYPDGILHEPIMRVKDTVDQNAGTYHVAYASMSPASPFRGSGIVFEITFTVRGQGKCLLEIYSSKLSDNNAMPIRHTVQNGYFKNYIPSPAEIYVTPSRIVSPELTPCEHFTVNVKLENVKYLNKFEFWLAYNTTILDIKGVKINSTFPPTQSEIILNEGEGKLKAAAWLLPAAPPFTGDIVLATIDFHVVKIGESIIDLYGVKLMDDWNDPIPFNEPKDGYFNNMLTAKIFVYPKEYINPALKPGDFVNFEIRMQNVIDFYSYELTLGYNKNIVNCLGVAILPPNNETNFIPVIIINNMIGRVKINFTFHPPAEPATILLPKSVAIITFQIKSYGVTDLDLFDTRIVDRGGKLIAHEVEDGFFATVIRDVAVKSIRILNNKVYSGKIVEITVEVFNLGDLMETFNVTLHYNDIAIETKTVYNLAAKQGLNITFYWNTSGLPYGANVTIKAEASRVPFEINIINNVYVDGYVFIKMLGDINGDRIIDIFDIAAATAAYDSRPGDPNWNPEADVAFPFGLIDIFDVVSIAAMYNFSY